MILVLIGRMGWCKLSCISGYAQVFFPILYHPRTSEKLNFRLFFFEKFCFLKNYPPESEILVSKKRERALCVSAQV